MGGHPAHVWTLNNLPNRKMVAGAVVFRSMSVCAAYAEGIVFSLSQVDGGCLEPDFCSCLGIFCSFFLYKPPPKCFLVQNNCFYKVISCYINIEGYFPG